MELARRGSFRVEFQGVDITPDISQYLLSMQYTDNEESEADDLQIKLQDVESIWLTQWLNSAIDASVAQGDLSAPAIKSMPTVMFGNKNDTVKTMQEILLEIGYNLPKYGADGYFGSETLGALKAFQSANGLVVDGICGPKTWEKLQSSKRQTIAFNKSDALYFSINAAIVAQNWEGSGQSVLDCGQFQLDTVEASGPPSVITIKATSLPFSAQIRQTIKSKAWENYTLSGIAKEMALANGMTCMFLASEDPLYERVEQYKMSDIALLNQLCLDAGISLKVTNNMIVLFEETEFEKNPPVSTITCGDGSYTKYKLSTGKTNTQYGACTVYYTTKKGKLKEFTYKAPDKTTSQSSQVLKINKVVSNANEAKVLAHNLLAQYNKFERSAVFTMPGNPRLIAGNTVSLAGFGAWNGKYIIHKSKHSLSGEYTTEISLRKVIE